MSYFETNNYKDGPMSQRVPALYLDDKGQLYIDDSVELNNSNSSAPTSVGPIYQHPDTQTSRQAETDASPKERGTSHFRSTKKIASFLAAAAVGCSVPYGAYRVVAGGDDRPLAQSVVEDFRGSANGLGVVAKTAFKASKVIIGVIH